MSILNSRAQNNLVGVLMFPEVSKNLTDFSRKKVKKGEKGFKQKVKSKKEKVKNEKVKEKTKNQGTSGK